MAYSRFRDRSGLTTRRRVIAYLQRERERMQDHDAPITPPVPTRDGPSLYYMMGFKGQAPNRTVSSVI